MIPNENELMFPSDARKSLTVKLADVSNARYNKY